jgi:hypothetical protein
VTAPVVPPALRRHAAEVSASEVTTLAGAALGSITAAVQRAAVDGLTVIEAQQVVDQALPAPARGARLTEGIGASAERIVRTQLGRLFNRGAQDAAEKLEEQVGAGLLQKEWVAALDSRTRASHLRAHGQRVGTEEVFLVGGARLRYPGDPLAPARETINCRCRMITVLPDDPEDLFRALALPSASGPILHTRHPPRPPRQPPAPPPPPRGAGGSAGRPEDEEAPVVAKRLFTRTEATGLGKILPTADGRKATLTIADIDTAPGSALLHLKRAGVSQVHDLDLSRVSVDPTSLASHAWGDTDYVRGAITFSRGAQAALDRYRKWKRLGKRATARLVGDLYDGLGTVFHEAAHFAEVNEEGEDSHGLVIEEGLSEAMARHGVQAYLAREARYRGSPAERAFKSQYLQARTEAGAYQGPVNLVTAVMDHIAVGSGVELTSQKALAFLSRWKNQATTAGRLQWAADALGDLYGFDQASRGQVRDALRTTAGSADLYEKGEEDLRFRSEVAKIYQQGLERGAAVRRRLP